MKYRPEVAADLAAVGWSTVADLGTRLRYGDAIPLLSALMADPSTRTGSRCMRLRYPISMAEIAIMAMFGGVPDEISPFKSSAEVRESEAFMADAEEEAEALSVMSPIWGGA